MINIGIYMLILVIILAVLYMLSCFVLGFGGNHKITLCIGWGLRVLIVLICISVIIALKL